MERSVKKENAFSSAFMEIRTLLTLFFSLGIIPEEKREKVETFLKEEEEKAPSFLFTKTFEKGDEDEDILSLQRFLNERGFPLSESGVGSLGFETTFFGEKTENALKLFQEKYRESILIPAGLSRATGTFGEFTLKKVNEIIQGEE
jgi:peptidoglycan hydrolase-like protein with peptidoglycan-binding domain